MNIVSICAAAVICAVMALLLRHQSPQISLLISVGAGVILLMTVIREIVLTSDEIQSILSAGGISEEYIMILLKTLGICYLTEFTCDTVSEAGLLSLSTNVSFVGKVLVLCTALPLFRDLLTTVLNLVNAV